MDRFKFNFRFCCTRSTSGSSAAGERRKRILNERFKIWGLATSGALLGGRRGDARDKRKCANSWPAKLAFESSNSRLLLVEPCLLLSKDYAPHLRPPTLAASVAARFAEKSSISANGSSNCSAIAISIAIALEGNGDKRCC